MTFGIKGRDMRSVDKEKSLMASGMAPGIPHAEASDLRSTRGNWLGRMDFMLSCIGYAVGLGNIWRFPYLCYRNGGAVFLIPYITFLFLCGMPLFFLEVSYGQFASLSPITVWYLSPLFKGIGYGMVLISGIVCIYYNIIIAWTLYYLFKSFSRVVPWATCDNDWNTKHCARYYEDGSNATSLSNATAGMAATVATTTTDYGVGNTTVDVNATFKLITPSEEFWQNHVLQITEGIDNMGSVRWELLGCLALAWVFVFLCLIKGIKSSGKVVYVTATFPYLVLTILLVRGLTLPGASEGIKFYLIPKWHRLLELKVWGEAAMQIFYSIGACWGALITFASYNKFHNNCYRDARIVPLLNCGTSIFAGFVIFSVIGFMAHETGSDISDVVTHGPGLVFVVYPEAVARMPFSPLWAVLFFLMLFMIGLDSQFGMFETMTSALVDEFPHLLRKRKMLLTAVLCFVEFLLGIPCIMQGGIYYLQIMDWYSSTFSLMILALTECLVISWIYGAARFYKDIELMIGYQPFIWFRMCWCVITPVMILFIFSYNLISHTPVTYGKYEYPGWAVGLGWVFALCSIVPLPAIAVGKFMMAKGPAIKRLKRLVQPAPEWGPALEEHRRLYLASLRGDRRGDQGEAAMHLNQKQHAEEELFVIGEKEL